MSKLREKLVAGRERGMYRMAPWAGLAFATSLIIVIVFPHQVGNLLVKSNMIALGAWLGYWIDRTAFPTARIHETEGADFDAAQIRRAIIIGATVLAIALAV